MDLWSDFNSDWGLDHLLSQPDGLVGDLQDWGHLKGGMDPACKPGETTDQQMVLSPQSEGPLDFEWMESGDLGSFLDSLDKGQDREGLSMQDGMLLDRLELKAQSGSGIDGQKFFSLVNSGSVRNLNEGLTPPESPEQVLPVIQLESDINNHNQLWAQSDASTSPILVSVEEYSPAPEQSPSVIQSPVDLLEDAMDMKPELLSGIPPLVFQSPVDFLEDPIDLKPELLDGVGDMISLAFTSSDCGDANLIVVESNNVAADSGCSFSSDESSSSKSPSHNPSSPRPSIDSLIQSSPELYKVIATPTDLSARFSPYTKGKGDQKSKGGSKAKLKSERKLVEPVPEEHFPSNLGKKERKKLQNKNAAIRYRQKKKAESECIFTEVQGLEDKNLELKTKVDDLQREVKYMKTLMEDIYRAKGLVK